MKNGSGLVSLGDRSFRLRKDGHNFTSNFVGFLVPVCLYLLLPNEEEARILRIIFSSQKSQGKKHGVFFPVVLSSRCFYFSGGSFVKGGRGRMKNYMIFCGRCEHNSSCLDGRCVHCSFPWLNMLFLCQGRTRRPRPSSRKRHIYFFLG